MWVRKKVVKIISAMQFDPIDSGPLKSARYLESMAIMLINLGYNYDMDTN